MSLSPRNFSIATLAAFAIGGAAAYAPQLIANVPQAAANDDNPQLAQQQQQQQPSRGDRDGNRQRPDNGGRREGGRRGHGGGEGRSGRDGMGFLRDIELDEGQKTRLQAIRQEYQPKMEAQHEAVRAAHEALDRMMASSASDNDLRSRHRALLTEKQKMDELRFNSMLEMRAVLTTEQRQQVAQRMEERRSEQQNRGGGRGQRGRGGGPGGFEGGPGGPGGPGGDI